MFVERGFIPKFDGSGRLMISYARDYDRYRRTQEVVGLRTHRPKGVLFLNRGTIVNTSPTVGRNRVVSIDGGAPVKMKRSALAGQPRPFNVLSRR